MLQGCRLNIACRVQHGAYSALLPELRQSDVCGFKNFLRMDNDSFLILLEKVHAAIEHKDTHMRDSISPAERLTVTLRYLATGK